VEFTFAGYDYVIPALSAADWLTVLMDKTDPWLIVPGLVEEPLGLGFDIIQSGEEYDTLILDIVEVATARKWWIGMRLIGIAAHWWATLGTEACRLAPPSQVSLPLWLDVFTENMFEHFQKSEPGEAIMATLKIEMPPPGFETEEMEMSAEQFLSIGDE
jgi:hypothetical protein